MRLKFGAYVHGLIIRSMDIRRETSAQLVSFDEGDGLGYRIDRTSVRKALRAQAPLPDAKRLDMLSALQVWCIRAWFDHQIYRYTS